MQEYARFFLMAIARERTRIPQSFLNATGFLLVEAAALNIAAAAEALEEEFAASWPDAVVMCYLLDQEHGVSQQSIADSCHINKAIVVQILDRLAERKLVKRASHPDDRRVNLVSLTGKGKHAGNRMISEMKRAQKEQVFDRLTARELEQLNELLRKIVLPEGDNT